ncbi:MAG: energy transducer TonB [Acidobacteria bacterium]|nr:energy transducer TonB [Acidobacteriota bacterium]
MTQSPRTSPTHSDAPQPSELKPRFEPFSSDETSVWTLTAQEEKKRPWPLIAAVAFHALLLMLQLPAGPDLEAEPEHKEHLFVVETPRFKPPEPPVIELQRPATRIQPIPDPTPDDPEPLVNEVEIEPELRLPAPDDIFEFPEGPPPLPRETGPLQIVGEVEAPVALEKVKPGYTELARRARLQGIVIVEAVINADGEVVDARIRKPLGLGLDESALDAVHQWRFAPATLRGQPVAVYMNLTVHFHLN